MASTYTDIGTELMTTGENAGNWGTKTNTNLQIIEEALRGYVSQSIAGGAQTTALTYTDGTVGDAARNMVIALTGTITGNQVVTVTAKEKMWIIDNQTSGAYTVQFMVSGQTGVTWGASDKGTKILYCNGTDVIDTDIGGVGAYDLNGATLTLDADGDTDITADTDDQIDIRIAGADDFQFTANTFTAQSGSTIAAQALTATTVTASGIIKTDDTTAATSTTDGSLQTDGGLSVAADAIIGDDLKLLSDSAVLSFGADSDTTLTHTDGTGLTLNSTNKLLFRDTGLYINSSTDGQLDLVADTEIQIAATTIDINGAIAMDGAITGATNITLSGELDAATLDISGNADIDGTTNLDAVDIDGAVQVDNTITVGADDQGYDVKLFGDTASAYMLWDTSADDLILGGAARIVVPDSGLVLGSTAVTTTAAEINLIDGGASTGTTAVADADGILTNDGGTMRLTTAATFKTYFQTGISSAADDISVGDDAVNLTTSSGNITIDAAANNTDIIFKGTDATADITMLTLDGSEAGAATFNDKVIATELDISGNMDIDGTSNLDAVDIDGAVQLDATLTVGVDDTGHDVKFFGATSGAYMLWDESTDDLVLAGAAKLYLYDAAGGEHISSDGTDLTLAAGADLNLTATTDINVPSGVGMTFGNDGEKIEGDGTDLTIAGNNINLTAVADVVIPANVGITFGSGEKIEGDSTDLTVTSGAKINLTATSDVHLPNSVGMVFGDAGEKIEGDGTDLTISSSALANIDAGTDIVLDADGGDIFFKDDGTTFGSATNTSGNLIIKSGTTTALTFSGANATFAGTLATAAGGFNIAGLDIDGATDLGEAIVDADLFIIDNGAGGTNRKVAASRIVTYIDANSSAATVGKAIAMAIVFG